MFLLALVCAFRSGADRYYLKKAVGERADGGEVFYYLRPRRFILLLKFYFSFYLIKLALLFVCMLPFVLFVSGLFYYVYTGNISASVFNTGVVLSVVLMIHGIIFFVRFNSFFFVVRYRFAAGFPENMRQLLFFSYRCILGNRKTVLIKKVSFIPWIMSCVFLLPISFVRSHYNQTMAQLAADLMQKHLQEG